MIGYDQIDRSPSRKTLVQFAVTFLVGAAILGAIFRWGTGRPAVAEGVWIAGAAGFVLALVPGVGRLFYIAWMGLGISIGLVTSPIVLGLVYFLLFFPLAIVFRLAGRDAMKRRLDPGAKSYWEEYPMPDDPTRFLRQF